MLIAAMVLGVVFGFILAIIVAAFFLERAFRSYRKF